ncbi:MAG TPA: leucine--tRNA ligase [Candidatus Omnitrophota bacterium]|nr:leucine--tRNA ligase [Candidatus Omnitrophota bacterium]
MEYDFKKIEKKWQDKWEKRKVFQAKEDKKKDKYYLVEMWPYPSGSGLHIGHAFNYTIGDILARFKKMQGFNVLHPMGFDSFGLPAENAAIKNKSHPKKYTEEAISNFTKQLKSLGFSYDWERTLYAHHPDYYKWDQWIFLKMLEKGLAYKKESPVNWCPKCGTVLANEQVHNGKCWIHKDTDVEIKHLNQWFFKITDYADELYEGINKLENWPERIRTMQRNWIGKSPGAEILFEINGKKWPIFTTRPDTIFGVTFMVVSAQHPKLEELITSKQKKEAEKFLKKIKSTSEKDTAKLEKEGVFTGSYAINPMTNEKVPIYAANFVIADYGSGMVMGVPAHDKRDFDFATNYNIPIKIVIEPKDFEIYERKGQISEPYEGDGTLVNSREFDGMENHSAMEAVIKALQKKGIGKKITNYKLRDWLVSRQRFWGTPIPIIYCDKCGVVPVPEKDLPVELPENIHFTSEKNPLIGYKPFVETRCPRCNGKAKRETDTMDTFVNSSWYFLRYADPKNSKKIFSTDKAEYWNPIDKYIGGAEHACMHLIYFRFYTKFLKDLGLIDLDEPTYNLFNQGMVHGEDGVVMSKSRGNVVDPLDMISKYGTDSLRIFLVSIASPESDYSWNNAGLESMHKTIKRIVEFFEHLKAGKSSQKFENKIHRAIRDVTADIESMKYNLAIIKIKLLFEKMASEKEIAKKDAEIFLKLISPFCPHITEELWEKFGNKGFISLAKWPIADESKINENLEKEEKSVENLIADIGNIMKIVGEKKKIFIYTIPNEKAVYKNAVNEISRKTGLTAEIYAVNDKEKYDPENKSKKAKPGKPAIYLE